MKFGQKVERSRYVRIPPSKKKGVYSPEEDNILPLIYPGKLTESTPPKLMY